jgi:hypothetical protein
MNRTSLAVLALITAVIVIAAVVSYSRRHSQPASPGSQPLYPALAEHVNDVISITVRTGTEDFLIARHGDQWQLETKGGYPVSFEKVKQTVLGLADLKIIEPKTSRPEYYDRLGVVEPGPDKDSTLVSLWNADEVALASLVIGDSAGASGRVPRWFVRRVDEPETWLVEGQLEIHRRPLDWIDREVLRLPRTRVKSVTINHPDGERVHVYRDDRSQRNFLVSEVPEDAELESDVIANPIAGALGFLRLDDVAPADEIDFDSAEVVIIEYACFNGLLVTIDLLPADEGAWIELSASAAEEAPPAGPDADADTPPETPAAQADEINERVMGWAYRISQSTINMMMKRMIDLIRETEAEPDGARENDRPEDDDAD